MRSLPSLLSFFLQFSFEASLEAFVLYWPLLLLNKQLQTNNNSNINNNNNNSFDYYNNNNVQSVRESANKADEWWRERGRREEINKDLNAAFNQTNKLINNNNNNSFYFSSLNHIPIGLLFSCLMAAVALGSLLFNFVSERK